MNVRVKAALVAATAATVVGGLALPANAGTYQAETVHGSFSCGGGSKQTLNYSYARGNVTVTVYYNNHCSHAMHIAGDKQTSRGTIEQFGCFTAPAYKKSKHVFRVNGTDFSDVNLVKHC
ncbi:hypothetical protein [Actinoallomurus sp. NPDC050550]|uniref:hypothetical protein n=1 Tax=Actinoallomurus sp. NPDC050550 TaxID=3154937 RepID=UPI0033CF1E8C